MGEVVDGEEGKGWEEREEGGEEIRRRKKKTKEKKKKKLKRDRGRGRAIGGNLGSGREVDAKLKGSHDRHERNKNEKEEAKEREKKETAGEKYSVII